MTRTPEMKVVILRHSDPRRGSRHLLLGEKHKIRRRDLIRMKHDGWDTSGIDKKYVLEPR